MSKTPPVRQLRDLVCDLMKTFDDYHYSTLGPEGVTIHTTDGRKIIYRITEAEGPNR